MTDQQISVGAWLPGEWKRTFTDEERTALRETDLDLLLIPENHDDWANRQRWIDLADEIKVAIYAGFERGDWIQGLFYDPITGQDTTYTKHTTAGKIAFQRDDWSPEQYLETLDFRGTRVGLTICHDHYISPLMGYQGLNGASILLNLSASPVKRHKWGEILQARAIENGAYTFCTMHGHFPDGSTKPTNKAHVFAFDPYGDPLTLRELQTDVDCALFETTPDHIYVADVDIEQPPLAKESLRKMDDRQPISRIRENTIDTADQSQASLSVCQQNDQLEFTYQGMKRRLPIGETRDFELGGETFMLVSTFENEALEPEFLYEILFSESEREDRTLLLHNHWESVDKKGYLSTIEPVLRARTVEWCSPVLATTPSESHAYQLANTAKATHEVLPQDGKFRFDLNRAWGIPSAMKPIHQDRSELRSIPQQQLQKLVKACSQLRS